MPATRNDISTSKSGPHPWCFKILTSKCASCRNGVHFVRHLNFQKWSESWCAFVYILTWKCSSRHNCVHFFDISTSKSGPRMRGVLNSLTWKCASRHNGVHSFDISNFQNWSEREVLLVHFDLDMCFAPQQRATFSTSQLPKVAWTWCALYILTSKCASRHNRVQFFSSHPTFRPSGATNQCKNTVFRDFPTFSRTCIFFPLTLSLL